MTDTESDIITNSRTNLEAKAGYDRRNPTTRDRISGEHVEPIVDMIKKAPPKEQLRMSNLTAGLVPGYNKELPTAAIKLDPARENITWTRMSQELFPYPGQETQRGHFRKITDSFPMQQGRKTHEAAKRMVDGLQASGFEPFPTNRKVSTYARGAHGVLYNTNDTDPKTRHLSIFLDWLNDNQVINQEQYRQTIGPAEKFGLEEHKGATGKPVDYGFSGVYDVLSVGAPGTAFEGKKIMTDLKTDKMNQKDLVGSANSKNIKYIYQAVTYNKLFGQHNIIPDYFATLYLDSGQWILHSKEEMDRIADVEYNNIVNSMHKEQAPYESIWDKTRQYMKEDDYDVLFRKYEQQRAYNRKPEVKRV